MSAWSCGWGRMILSIVPITTIRDAWEPHEDHGHNTNPVGDETSPSNHRERPARTLRVRGR